MAFEALFVDVGGVMGTNGWDRHHRQKATEKFNLDHAEVDARHKMIFNTHEEGKLTLDEYLDQVIFYQPRSFSRDDFKQFMYSCSEPWPEMIGLFTRLKKKYNLHITIVSNEGRELTMYRVDKFKLKDFVDTFIFSCFVNTSKPDPQMYRLALDVSLRSPEQVLYFDDRAMFVENAARMGIRGIVHKEYEETRRQLAEYGLPDD